MISTRQAGTDGSQTSPSPPFPLPGGLRAGNQLASGDHQEHREFHHRLRVPAGMGEGSAPSCPHGEEGGGGGQRSCRIGGCCTVEQGEGLESVLGDLGFVVCWGIWVLLCVGGFGFCCVLGDLGFVDAGLGECVGGIFVLLVQDLESVLGDLGFVVCWGIWVLLCVGGFGFCCVLGDSCFVVCWGIHVLLCVGGFLFCCVLGDLGFVDAGFGECVGGFGFSCVLGDLGFVDAGFGECVGGFWFSCVLGDFCFFVCWEIFVFLCVGVFLFC